MSNLFEAVVTKISDLPAKFNIYKSTSKFVASRLTLQFNSPVYSKCNFCKSNKTYSDYVFLLNGKRICIFCKSLLTCVNEHICSTYIIIYEAFHGDYIIYCDFCFFNSFKNFIKCEKCKFNNLVLYGLAYPFYNYKKFTCFKCKSIQSYNMKSFLQIRHHLIDKNYILMNFELTSYTDRVKRQMKNNKLMNYELNSFKDRCINKNDGIVKKCKVDTLFHLAINVICNSPNIYFKDDSDNPIIPTSIIKNFKDCYICGFQTFTDTSHIYFHDKKFKNFICNYCAKYLCDNNCKPLTTKHEFYSFSHEPFNNKICCSNCKDNYKIITFECDYCKKNILLMFDHSQTITNCIHCLNIIIDSQNQTINEYIQNNIFTCASRLYDKEIKDLYHVENSEEIIVNKADVQISKCFDENGKFEFENTRIYVDSLTLTEASLLFDQEIKQSQNFEREFVNTINDAMLNFYLLSQWPIDVQIANLDTIKNWLKDLIPDIPEYILSCMKKCTTIDNKVEYLLERKKIILNCNSLLNQIFVL